MHYMVSCPEIPGELLRDNPSGLRVIFALRDPISRMWSDYRFAANWYRNKGLGFNDVVVGFNEVVVGFNDVVVGFNDVVLVSNDVSSKIFKLFTFC